MKLLESLRIRASASVRRQKARFGVGEKPARLEIRLDGFDAPVAFRGECLGLEAWQSRIVEVLQWAGALPVRITAEAAHPLLPDLVRFCHRLEMPVTVRTGPSGLDVARAEELVDRGMARCELVTVLDGPGEVAAAALVHTRHSRGATLSVVIHFPVAPNTAAAAPGVFAAARALGVDTVVLAAPWQGADLTGSARAGLEKALAEGWPLQATGPVAREALQRLKPGGVGAPRGGGSCALGGLRLALAPDGSANVCPFHPGRHTGPLAESPAGLAEHRRAVRGCGRVCGHPELV